MENFSIVDIFDTKGTEYLFVIGYLLVLIIFWKLSGRQTTMKEQKQEASSYLSTNVLRIPHGIFYSKNHTWTHLEESGEARVGLDTFIHHITGRVKLTNLKKTGETINKGDMIAEIVQDGKRLRVFSPISGKVMNTNGKLYDNPEILNEEPYQKGWIYKMKPTKWIKEINSYYIAEDAINWTKKELDRFKDFLAGESMKKYSLEPSMVILQDGGEIRDQILAELPEEIWNDFQKEFLDMNYKEA